MADAVGYLVNEGALAGAGACADDGEVVAGETAECLVQGLEAGADEGRAGGVPGCAF